MSQVFVKYDGHKAHITYFDGSLVQPRIRKDKMVLREINWD